MLHKKKHNQIQNKVKPNCLVHKGTQHPKKKVGQLREGLNETPLKKTQLPTQQQQKKNTALTSFLSNRAESESERITQM